jgi:hypothetical protein
VEGAFVVSSLDRGSLVPMVERMGEMLDIAAARRAEEARAELTV